MAGAGVEPACRQAGPHKILFYNVFKNSLPQPDFKYFSLVLASDLDLYFSINKTLNGRYDLVVFS